MDRRSRVVLNLIKVNAQLGNRNYNTPLLRQQSAFSCLSISVKLAAGVAGQYYSPKAITYVNALTLVTRPK